MTKVDVIENMLKKDAHHRGTKADWNESKMKQEIKEHIRERGTIKRQTREK